MFHRFLLSFKFLFLFLFLTLTLALPSIAASNSEIAKISFQDIDDKGKQIALATCTLVLMVDGPSRTITIQNNSLTLTALNISSNFVGTALEGNVSETGNTCASLEPGKTCTLTFTPGSTVVPATSFTIKGTNTSSITAVMQINDKPTISITAPAQQSRIVAVGGAPLILQVTNSASSAFSAENVNVTSTGICSSLTIVPDAGCSSLAPGDSCNISVSSATNAFQPCTLTISGSNTANSPTTLIAFSFMNGLVFEGTNGTTGKIVINTAFSVAWTSVASMTGATSLTDGFSNTNIITTDGSCTGNANNCAAARCRMLNVAYYLPALNELSSVHSSLCSNAAIPCNFGGFTNAFYWSSSESTTNPSQAHSVLFPSGLATATPTKTSSQPVRCILTF